MTPGEEFIYKTTEDGVHYAYGFNGIGFKYTPLHGKIICDSLVTKTDFKYLPKALKAKL